LIDEHREDIDAMAATMSKSDPGSRAYLACYKNAIKVVEEGLDDETRLKYRAEAKKWSEQQPPPQHQRRYVQASCFIRSAVTNIDN
jgi:hypothetical protein